jgi:hypothetical protein
MVNPDIRKLQILNDLIAQTLDVINQRSVVGGLSHSPYVPDFGMSQINPALAQYGVGPYGIPQSMVSFTHPQIGQIGQGIPFGLPWNQGLTHTPFTAWGAQPGQGLGGFGQGVPGQPFGQGLTGFGQQLGQLPYASPWSQGLMHSPFTGVPAQGYGVDPRLASFASPYSQAGFAAGRFGGIGAIPGVVGGVPGIGVTATGVPFYGFGG